MRITGGIARSRKLVTPAAGSRNDTIRPTTDRVREALFNILGDHVIDAKVLDLYAGTGSFGLDALSRGAGQVLFVDISSTSLAIIRQNLHTCFREPAYESVRMDLVKSSSFRNLKKRFAEQSPFTIIFLDPPYEKKMTESTLTMVEKTGLVAANGVVIAEERWKVLLPEKIGTLRLHQQRRYGESGIWIYKPESDRKK